MKYYTIKRKVFLTEHNFIFRLFGLDGENNEHIITRLNFENLENYVADIMQEDGLDVSPEKKKKLLETLEEIKKSLNDFDEIQIKKE